MSDSASSSGGSGTFSPLSAASSRTSMDEGDMLDEKDKHTPAGHGSSLWSSITGAASNLTISVSKALSANVAAYSGEVTPVGGESRLTRAMKAYHIEKARDPADLPEWLFDERERGVRGHQTSPKPRSQEQEAPPSEPASLSRSMTTARREEMPMPPRIARGPTLADRRANENNAGSEEHVTKSMARLRALRDAKRNAKVRFGGEDEEDSQPAPPPAPERPERSAARPQPAYSASAPILPSARYAPVSREAPERPRGMPAPLGAGAPLGGRGRQPRLGLPSGVRPVRA